MLLTVKLTNQARVMWMGFYPESAVSGMRDETGFPTEPVFLLERIHKIDGEWRQWAVAMGPVLILAVPYNIF